MSEYCTISINLTHTCDYDMLDQFNILTLTTSDCDMVKFSTLCQSQNGSF
jgi:hypothetical protein